MSSFYGRPSLLRFKAALAAHFSCCCCCCSCTDSQAHRRPSRRAHQLPALRVPHHLVKRRRKMRDPLIRSCSLWNIQPCYRAVRERLCPISFHLSAVSAAAHGAVFLQVNGLPGRLLLLQARALHRGLFVLAWLVMRWQGPAG